MDAIRAGDRKALLAILGEAGKGLVFSGDEVADRRAGERFVASTTRAIGSRPGAARSSSSWEANNFPFAIPLVPDGPSWRFDTEAGKEEMLNRRIGENELNTIQVCLAFVDAQREYYARDPTGIHCCNTPNDSRAAPASGTGLYWPTRPGELLSPLGAFVARARDEGYTTALGRPSALLGLLLSDSDRPGKGCVRRRVRLSRPGQYDRRLRARWLHPAQYGVSGIMTFLVNHGWRRVPERPRSERRAIARAMKAFNPDSTWKKVSATRATERKR